MIPEAHLTEWSQHAPWISSAQVEQDLVLSRALIEIYCVPHVRENLIFRGGTALHKLILQPAARYSEDLDFVQLHPKPIGQTLDLIRERLSPWLGEARSDVRGHGATLLFRFESELPPVIRLRLKIEINTREHGNLLPLESCPFTVDSRWFQGHETLPVYQISELLGTKLRALYQRRKGRDLFDLWHAHQAGVLDAENVVSTFHAYMRKEGHTVSAAEFQTNLELKLQHKAFLSDIPPLLRPGVSYDAAEAADWLLQTLIPLWG